MTAYTCFNFNNKGKQTNLSEYYFDSPEHQYYQNAQGKFFVPISSYASMRDNYNMIFGVHGTAGFIPTVPLRYAMFVHHYGLSTHKRTADHIAFKRRDRYFSKTLAVYKPNEYLADYLPIDFVTIDSERNLNWKNFRKVVSGDRFDVWEREGSFEFIKSVENIKVLPAAHVTIKLREPYTGTVYVSEDDNAKFQVMRFANSSKIDGLSPDTLEYSIDKNRSTNDNIFMRVTTERKLLVWIPEMFSSAWKLTINGEENNIFPINFIFIGFNVPEGTSQIELKFVPHFYKLGLVLNIFAGFFLLVTLLNLRYKA